MGKLADVLQGVPLSSARQQQVAGLDRELAELKIHEDMLEDENRRLHDAARTAGRADGNGDDGDHTLSGVTRELLASIGAAAIPKDELFNRMGLTAANGDRHLDILLGRRFVAASLGCRIAGVYDATDEGRAYLSRNHGA